MGHRVILLYDPARRPCYSIFFNTGCGSHALRTSTRFRVYSKGRKVGNPIASILKSNVEGIPALFGLNPVSDFLGFAVGLREG